MLEEELHQAGRWELAQDDFLLAQHVDTPKEKLNGSSWKRFSSRKNITPRELTVLSELTMCRDAIAEKLDRPPFKVVADKILLDIAKNIPEKDVDLAGLGLSQKQIHLWGNQILEAVKRGVDAPLVKREQAKRSSEAMLKRLDKLKTWRKKIAAEMKVESDIVLPKKYLNLLSEHPPGSLAELKSFMKESPHRFDKFGNQIYYLLGG
jgi:ribonuclease D